VPLAAKKWRKRPGNEGSAGRVDDDLGDRRRRTTAGIIKSFSLSEIVGVIKWLKISPFFSSTSWELSPAPETDPFFSTTSWEYP